MTLLMEDRHEARSANRRGAGGGAPTVVSPLVARARGQDRERRAHGYRSKTPTDSSAAAVSTRRFQLQQSQVPTARHARPEPVRAPEPEPELERDPVISRRAPEPFDDDDGFDASDDWVEPRSPKNVRLILGALGVGVLVLVFVTLGRSHDKRGALVPMVAALPATLDLGSGRPTFERPAPAPEPAPVETAPEPSAVPAHAAPKAPPVRTTSPAPRAPVAAAPRPEPTPPTKVSPPTPAAELAAIIEAAPPEGEHRAYITSRPAGATVILEGRVVGRTPTHVAWNGKQRHEVEINLPGHDSSTLVLTPKSSGRTLSIVLDEAADEDPSFATDPPVGPARVEPAPAPRAAKPAPVAEPAPAPPAAVKPSPAKPKSVLDGAFDGF
ncbi:MAG: PEGA domain-containing protein [Deltaproteobacteria bacterium]|nr:PEGA domain-containing protein [Deltaproteobacteria bacterium]